MTQTAIAKKLGIYQSAVASNAVTTAKINAKAVTDEKINSVSASKVIKIGVQLKKERL